MKYLTNGIPYGGGAVPGINSPLYVNIIDELDPNHQADPIDTEITSWVTKLPTQLVILQPIDDNNLPCWE